MPPFYLSPGLLPTSPNSAVLVSSCRDSWLLFLGVHSPDGGVNCVFQTGAVAEGSGGQRLSGGGGGGSVQPTDPGKVVGPVPGNFHI